MSISARLYGWYPSGNGIVPLTINPSGTTDVGVVIPSSNNAVLSETGVSIGAIMCAMYVISGNDTNGFQWVPLRSDWLK